MKEERFNYNVYNELNSEYLKENKSKKILRKLD
jgi:hypothetical protein